ncbi:putative helicase [Salmonella phage 21]|nr:putative helicase [Salmonella phage 21]
MKVKRLIVDLGAVQYLGLVNSWPETFLKDRWGSRVRCILYLSVNRSGLVT